MSDLIFWLESVFPGANDRFDTLYVPSDYYSVIETEIPFKDMYDPKGNDIDLCKNPDDVVEYLESCEDVTEECDDIKKTLQKSVQYYDTHIVLVLPGIVRSHTNYLFKKMLLELRQFGSQCNVPNLSNPKNITYENIPFLSPADKTLFYEFCFQHSFVGSQMASYHNVQRPVAPPIITKQTYGRIEYLNTIKKEKQKRLAEEESVRKQPYTGLTIDKVNLLIDEIVNQFDKMVNVIDNIWSNVLRDYLDNVNYDKLILDKIMGNIRGKSLLNDFFLKTVAHKKLEYIYNKLEITRKKLEYEEHVKHIKQEKIKQQDAEKANEFTIGTSVSNRSQQSVRKVQKIDTTKLVGML